MDRADQEHLDKTRPLETLQARPKVRVLQLPLWGLDRLPREVARPPPDARQQ